MRLLIFLLTLSLPVFAGNIKDPRVWSQDSIKVAFPNDMPFKDETFAALVEETENLIPIPLVRDDNFTGDIAVTMVQNNNYSEGIFTSFSGNRMTQCQVQLGTRYTFDKTAFISNAVHGIVGHCLSGLTHTTQFVFSDNPTLEVGSFNQPLMASGGRIISYHLSEDDKNVCLEAYGVNKNNRFKLTLLANQKFDNIFLINDNVRKYSLSKLGGDNVTIFNNVYPGHYIILVRKQGSLKSWFICNTNKGYKVCSRKQKILITKNKRIRVQ